MSWLRPPFFALLLVTLALAASSLGCARPAACQRNSDCNQAYCSDGECKKDCIDEAKDCPAGWTCDQTARCVAPGGSSEPGGGEGGDVGPGQGGAGGEGGQSAGGAGGQGGDDPGAGGGGQGGSGGGGATTKVALDRCSSDSDCTAPAFCRPAYRGGPSRCTFSCTSSQQCPQGTRCETVGGESYCAQSDIGKACSSGDECNFACLSDTQRICTSSCADARDCPNGYGCMNVAGQKVCAKTNIYCGEGGASQCIAQDACLPGGPSAGQSMVADSCTVVCTSSLDCPQRAQGLDPWLCQGGLCKRPKDIFGPQAGGETAEYVCAESPPNTILSASLCGDSFRWDRFAGRLSEQPPPFSGQDCYYEAVLGDPYDPDSPWNRSYPGNDSCIDTCRYQGGCAFGFACSPIAALPSNQTARIGLCLPAGGGEIGAYCSRDDDCALGYCHDSGKCTRDCSPDGVCPKGSSCTAVGDATHVETGEPFRRCL